MKKESQIRITKKARKWEITVSCVPKEGGGCGKNLEKKDIQIIKVRKDYDNPNIDCYCYQGKEKKYYHIKAECPTCHLKAEAIVHGITLNLRGYKK